MDDLTLPLKELINVGLKISSMFNLLVLYVLWKCLTSAVKAISPFFRKDPNLMEDSTFLENKEVSTLYLNGAKCGESPQLSFTSMTKIGFIKLVKLNFTSISTFTFHMIHCVSISGNLHLFVYGDQQCYNWWQQIILFGVLPVVVLFPLSFGISLNMLKERWISPTTFLLASVMPFFTIGLYVKNMTVGLNKYSPSDEDELCTKEILLLEEELFNDDGRGIRWPVIQLYRNLLVAVLNNFVLNPIYRSMAFIPVFLFFALQDRHRMPFKNMFLNYLQIFTSASLLIINTCNTPASISKVFDLMAVSGMTEVIRALKYVEFVTLAMVPMSLIVWKLWQFILTKRQSKKNE